MAGTSGNQYYRQNGGDSSESKREFEIGNLEKICIIEDLPQRAWKR